MYQILSSHIFTYVMYLCIFIIMYVHSFTYRCVRYIWPKYSVYVIRYSPCIYPAMLI